jgi:beta-lactamase superfamily II metal-dependent hydrolase
MFHIEMLPAGIGDCLLVEYGDSCTPHWLLIDAGPYMAFKECAARINVLASSGLRLELLAVTHIDNDHIDGIIKLLDAPPAGIHLGDIWFNAWRHLRPERFRSSDQVDTLGPVQGEMLSARILECGLPWNDAFGGGPVSTGASPVLHTKELDGDLTLTLLSPRPEELLALEGTWEKVVRNAGLDPDSREEALEVLSRDTRYQALEDTLGEEIPDMDTLLKKRFSEHRTKSNASSIAFLAEHGGKSCLFTADAQPSILVASVNRLLQQRQEKTLHVDAVKVSHHGSRGNTSPTLLSLLDCRHFLVSTNGAGKSAHPHAEAIARIISKCGPNIELWFNYRSDENKIWDDPDLARQYQYVTHYPPKGQEGLVVPLSEL